MGNESTHYDADFEELIPTWRDVTAEEYMAREWLRYGAFTMRGNTFKNSEMEAWAHRCEDIFYDLALLNECRRMHLSDSEIEDQERQKQEILKHGL